MNRLTTFIATFIVTFVGDLRRVVHFDVGLFHGRRRLLLAFVGAMFVPALYATTYLTSAWDPYAHLDRLHVVVVNDDTGVDITRDGVSSRVDVGARIVARLLETKPFVVEVVADEASATAAVVAGRAAFAVVVPNAFSKTAVPATHDAPGRLRILVSEGNSFMGATIARRFASELATTTNATLNEERWRVVFSTIDASGNSVARLQAGVQQLVDGSTTLDDGAAQLHDGAGRLHAGTSTLRAGSVALKDGSAKVAAGTQQLVDGVDRIGAGLRTLDEKLPSSSTLAPLSAGAHDVAVGNAKLAEGLHALSAGTTTAKHGATQLKDGTKGIPVVGGTIADGAGQLEAGLGTLEAGAQQAASGANRLRAGSAKLDDGVRALVDGVNRAHDGVHEFATKTPTLSTLQPLTDGSAKVAEGSAQLSAGSIALDDGSATLHAGLGALHDGTTQLRTGLLTLQAALPNDVAALDGDAGGLARSVQADVVALTAVGVYGNSMAPYFVGLSLWVGVVMTGFIFQLRWFAQRLVRGRRPVSKASLVLGRLVVPGAMVLGQATLLTLALRFVVGVSVPSTMTLWLIAATTSLTFMAILLMLVAVFGDVGKVVALLLLVFQMSASGGVFPVELSGGVFSAVSTSLPFTWVVRATRAALFGAFDGAWLPATLTIAAFGVGAVVVAVVVGRFKYVPRHGFRPLLDV